MGHPKYGDKFTCFSCGAKFYNLNKPEATCPKCGVDQGKAPKKRGMKPAKPIVPVPTEEFGADEEPIADEEIHTLPIAGHDDEESFDPNKDQLSVDETPDRDF